MEDSGPFYDLVWHSSQASPEARLFEAVLLTFIIDAQQDFVTYKESSNGNAEKYYQRLTEHVATAQSEHIEMICECINLRHKTFVECIVDICVGKKSIDLNSVHYKVKTLG